MTAFASPPVPASGTVLGGTVIVFYVIRCAAVAAVFIDNISVAFTADTSNPNFIKVTCTTPSHTSSAGPVDIKVTTDVGVVINHKAFKYTFAVPTVTSVTPSTGTMAGGTSVAIAGTHFDLVNRVVFRKNTFPTMQADAASFSIGSSIAITAVTPPGFLASPVDVLVMNPEQQGFLSNAFTFAYPVPNVTSAVLAVSPANPLGGQTMTILGSGFTGATKVTVHGVPCTGLRVLSDLSMTFEIPAFISNTLSWDIKVFNPISDSGTSGNGLFTYTWPVPLISRVSPISGTHLGGTVVSIFGTNLSGVQGPTGVSIGGLNPGNAGFWMFSDRQIVFKTPAQAAGSVNIFVENSFAVNSNFVSFTYT